MTDLLYEVKLEYYSKAFEDKVRTFCMNPVVKWLRTFG